MSMNNGHHGYGGALLAEAVQELYRLGETDYSFEPLVRVDPHGRPVGCIEDGDAVIFCCRRGEREIQLTEAFTAEEFPYFPRQLFHNLPFVLLTLYHDKFKNLPVAFAPARASQTLGEVASRAGLRQLRVAEAEKFAHVTFFLNGGNNQPFPGEEDVCLPSPKGIPFDRQPELSLPQVAAAVVDGINRGYDLIVTNFANGDVIGHTANREAKIQCAEAVDNHLKQVVEAALAADYAVLITADHGNLEKLAHADGSPHVSHTTNLVPFIVLDARQPAPLRLRDGKLADIAPTILAALGVDQPESMDGETLAPGHAWGGKRRVLLVILDGWGMGNNDAGNPIFLAHTPYWDEITARGPLSRLQASGEAVGLQAGKAGNSEAGHMNTGAGRVVLQDDVRLDLAMQDGSFYSNETLCGALQAAQQRGRAVHLLCLLTEKSSHGSIEYPLALLRMAQRERLDDVYLHIIFDGRSTEPGSAPQLLETLESQIREIGVGQIVSGIGRGLALDRGGNYAKTQKAYDALVFGMGKKYPVQPGRGA